MNPRLGLDYSARPATPEFAQEAASRGFSFAIRYLCFPDHRPINATKILTPVEARTLSEAGLDVGLVWQNSKHDALGGAPAGTVHGREARRQAELVGAPEGAWIFFAVGDYDAPVSDHDRIASYLEAVSAELGPYLPAGYGKRAVLEAMQDRGLIVGLWQSYGFSRPIGEISPRAHVFQRREQTVVAGVLCDVNEARSEEFGAWRTGGGDVMLHDLYGVLSDAGLDVIPVEGWHTRGAKDVKGNVIPMEKPRGITCHHDAVMSRADIGSLGILVGGRKDLPGPLCHLALGRSGRWYCIAAAKANHAGKGSWHGVSRSTQLIGIEAANDGVGEPWPAVQLESYIAGCAALCEHYEIPADMVHGHKEFATPKGRKVDPFGIDMPAFRIGVGLTLADSPPEPPEEDDLTTEEHNLLWGVAARAEANEAAIKKLQDGMTKRSVELKALLDHFQIEVTY